MTLYCEIVSCNNCHRVYSSEVCSECKEHSEWEHAWGLAYIEGIIKKSEGKKDGKI